MVSPKRQFLFFVCIIVIILTHLPNEKGQFSYPVHSLAILFLIFLTPKDIIKIYRTFVILFIITTIPSIIVLISYILKINHIFPSRIMIAGDRPFIVFPGTIVQPFQFIKGIGLNFFRISGLQGEPGGVGTIALLILVVEKFNLKIRRNIYVLGIGCISFSLTFYILISIAYLYKLLLKKNMKQVFRFIGISLLVVFFVMNSVLFNFFILDRLEASDLENEQIGNYRRTAVKAGVFFHYFFNQKSYFILFGHGVRGNKLDNAYYGARGSNYMAFLYNFGILTTLLIFLIFYVILRSKYCSRWGLVMLILIILVFYQRPNIFNSSFILLILMASIQFLELKNLSPLNKI